MTVDQYINNLGNARLQEHLLAIRPTTMTEAITAGSEFLLVRGGQIKVRQMEVNTDEESETKEQVMPIRTTYSSSPDKPASHREISWTWPACTNTACFRPAHPCAWTAFSGLDE